MNKMGITDGLLGQAATMLARSVAGPNPLVNTPNEVGRVAGFWPGLWHGSIAPVTFIVSLFSDKVAVYEVHNNGKWYLLGFLLGVTSVWGGSRVNSARRSQARLKRAGNPKEEERRQRPVAVA
jgi:hypothetical protein